MSSETPEQIASDYEVKRKQEQAEEKARLKAVGVQGEMWTTEELREVFEVEGFTCGYCVARRKADGVLGSLDFTHMPRVYHSFVEHKK